MRTAGTLRTTRCHKMIFSQSSTRISRGIPPRPRCIADPCAAWTWWRWRVTAPRPRLACAAFFIAEPNQVFSLEYDHVDIDCRGGDFIKPVFDGWVLKGEKFPSLQDHALPLSERYLVYCSLGSCGVRSSQNVFTLFFRVRHAGDGFTVTVRQHLNPFRESSGLQNAL
ncbi:hypothetical protein NHX12_027712 [Muraenolepis orangiensis]|uniref:Corticotropin-releasing factor binding protein N-terminal domain-containing protein n=1 Tax=Muraenolepis orangiensis TaxID=630683 RepID=A0A9Q0IM46_9TELE|nr:hypothetical protein NHX12_027712 [Muraenolepis orangiensis]